MQFVGLQHICCFAVFVEVFQFCICGGVFIFCFCVTVTCVSACTCVFVCVFIYGLMGITALQSNGILMRHKHDVLRLQCPGGP